MITIDDRWTLWSTQAHLVIATDDESAAATRLAAARRICDQVLSEIDAVANRFTSSSELSQLRNDGSVQQISPLLRALISQALDGARRTDGALDPTVGQALVDLGYDRDIRLIEDGGRLRAQVTRVPGWRTVRLEGTWLRLPPGVRLDLGATAKASAADRCAQAVQRALGCGVLVGLGGDIATSGPAPGGGWQIRVQDLDTDQPAFLALPAGWAISTSSTRKRTWTADGGASSRHHIVDPATGLPATDTWSAVSVVAPRCVDANAVSTAVVVKGRGGRSWAERTGLPIRLLDGESVIRLNDWPAAA